MLLENEMNRREALKIAGATSAATFLTTHVTANAASPQSSKEHLPRAQYVSSKDGSRLYVQDWGVGRPIVFIAAWALHSQFWGTHMLAVASAGFRAVAFDRRGHGRSDAPSLGYDADTLADDLAEVLNALDLRNVVLVTHSMGAGEAARYLTRHGAARVAKVMFVAPTTPYLVKAPDNSDAVPAEILDGMLATIAKNFPKWVLDNEPPFFIAETDDETRAWIKAMMLSISLPIAISIRRLSGQTDFRSDIANIEIPVLVLHGDRDASAPLQLTAAKTARLLRNGRLVIYENAPHGLPLTHRDRFLEDLVAFAAT